MAQAQGQSGLVGRERELAALGGLLGEALAGRGGVALIGGEAGIGKTALARACRDEARERGFRALACACYDTGTPPPYGPWRELAAGVAGVDGPSFDLTALGSAQSPDAFAAELRGAMEGLAARGPLLLVMEDLHWADPESLAFLRVFARSAGSLPLLLVATYRDDDLKLNPALDQLLPHLVREANAERIHLAPLAPAAVASLVEQRYGLGEADLTRLTAHLGERSQGLPLYVLELLRALEEEQRLRLGEDGWALGEIDPGQVPLLARQVIDGRLSRLPAEARRLLELAAVIGQDVPLQLWRQVSGAGDAQFDEAVEAALDARVLEEDARAGLRMRFTHALVRDALYAGIPLSRRRAWRRRVAEALEPDAGVEPETIAHHYRQALDPRAAEWFVRAGRRVEQVALLTAANHYAMALEMMGPGDATPGERGWLTTRRAALLRIADPRAALALLETAEALAEEAGDEALRAYVTFTRGQVRTLADQGRAGIADLEESVALFKRLPAEDVARVEAVERDGVFLSRDEMEGHVAAVLASVGRVNEALERVQAIVAREEDTLARVWWAQGIALALLGRASEAREAYAIARDAAQRAPDASSVVLLWLYQLSNVEIPYGADNVEEQRRIAREAEAVWRRVGGAHGDVSPRLAWLTTLHLEGEWQEARALASSGVRLSEGTTERDLLSINVLAKLARAQGDSALGWELVGAILPGGPQSTPGDMDFRHGLSMMRVAAGLCMDRDDLPAARSWLVAHDRWLAWSGAALGRADGQNAWAEYAIAAGDMQGAHRHATEALALASEPRQPLALLAAHRLLGAVEAQAGRISASREHLDAGLELAEACSAPHERALTLLAVADLRLRAAEIDGAREALEEARAIFERLGAGPDLARAAALAARVSEQSKVASRTAPAGLSPRESEVLRMIAGGRSNREIADTLFLSERTVERHITNLYGKIGVQNRSEAIAFAHAQGLV